MGVLIAMSAACGDVADHPSQITDEELFEAMDVTRAGLERVREAVEAEDYETAAHAWAEYFSTREKPTPHFSRDTWPQFIRQEFPQLAEALITKADQVARGEIAQGAVALSVDDREIDWLSNPTKDTSWGGMVGPQWFLIPLGRAYLLTGDEKYAEAFAWIFDSWYDHQVAIREQQGGLGFDPVFRAYYPGIRALILADNYYSCAPSPALTPQLHVKVMKQLLGCASWLAAHEQGYRIGNQQVTAVLGCGIVGLMFPEFKQAEAWVELAETRMKEHLLQDFFADGGHMELCTQYHKSCLRCMTYVALTAERNGRPSLFDDAEAAAALERAYEWLAKLIMPTGETPALHSAVFSTDWAIYLLVGASRFNRPDFLWLARRFWDRGEVPNQKGPVGFANYIINESMGHEAVSDLEPVSPDFASVRLSESGFAVMRTGWEPEDRYLVFQYGWANTAHAYPGALAFCLQMNGDLVATHPGSPRSYSHPAYRYCHSTPSHNVVSIDMASYPVQGRRNAAPGGHVGTLADLPGAWYVSGYHEGYTPPFEAVIERSLLVIKDGPIIVRDLARGGEGHRAQWNFHTPLELEVGEDRRAALSGRGSYSLCPAFADEIEDVKIEQHWEAVLPRDCQPDDCGKPVNVLRYEKAIGAAGARFCVGLFEGQGEIEAVSESAFRLRSEDAEYLLLFGAGEVDRVSADAECACVEFEGGQARRAWVFEGTRLSVGGVSWLAADETQTIELAGPEV